MGSRQTADELPKYAQGPKMTFVSPGAVVRGGLGDHRNWREVSMANVASAVRIGALAPHGRIML